MWGFACLASDLQTHIQSHSDLLRFDLPFQIHSVSLRFIQSHSDQVSCRFCLVSCKLTQIYSASCSFTRIPSDSQHFTQSHADSFSFPQVHSDTLSRTRIHSDSHSLAQDSLCLPQTNSDSPRFVQSCTDLPKLTNPFRSTQIRSDSLRLVD